MGGHWRGTSCHKNVYAVQQDSGRVLQEFDKQITSYEEIAAQKNTPCSAPVP
jgi:hypothetical protein